jgi:eukaryotic-like serine/threonine-protein kinase
MDLTGRTAGTYRIQDKLGEGGMGAVYRGVDMMVERTVAVKVLKPEIAGNPEIVERFRTEAVTLARLNHPAIATLYTFFREGAEYFMVMEFVSGSTLEAAIRNAGALPWRQATEVMLHILEALQHAHQYGVLHRDIKPANIMLPTTGGVKVTDFGIAQVLGAARLTREGRMVGTLEYLAPERVLGKPFDERSDLYSAGVVFYEMLSGHLPFEADTDYALLRAQAEAPPPPIENFGVSVPRPLIEVLWRSLAKLPEQRYASAAMMAAALRDAKARAEADAAVSNMSKETRMAGAVPPPPARPVSPATVAQPMYTPPVPGPVTAPANAGSRVMWGVGALFAVAVLGGATMIAVRNYSSQTDPKNKPVAAVTPNSGGDPVVKRREPIIPVGPAVEINDGQPAANPTPQRTDPPSVPKQTPSVPGKTPALPPQTPPQTPAVVTPVNPPTNPNPVVNPAARGAIGVRGVYVAGQAAVSLQLPSAGLLIQEVQRGSGAEAAGLHGPSNAMALPGGGSLGIGGDLITAIDGQPIQNQESPGRILAAKHAGDAVTLTLVRAGRFMNVPMRLGEGVDTAAPQPLTQVLPPAQPQLPPQQPQPNVQPPPNYNTPPVTPPGGSGAPQTTGQRIPVIHDHGGLANNREWFACRGYLQTIGNELVYVVQATNDGRNDNFRIPLTDVQEVKANVLPIRTLQAFHVKIGGKSFNFVPQGFSPVQAVSEIQRAMRK